MYYHHHYVIDWDKVQSLDDLKRLLKAISFFSFEPNHPHLADVLDLTRKEPKPATNFTITG